MRNIASLFVYEKYYFKHEIMIVIVFVLRRNLLINFDNEVFRHLSLEITQQKKLMKKVKIVSSHEFVMGHLCMENQLILNNSKKIVHKKVMNITQIFWNIYGFLWLTYFLYRWQCGYIWLV